MFSQANENIDIDLYMANKYRIKPAQASVSRSVRQQDEQFFQYLRKGRYKQAYIFGQQIMNKRPNNKSIPNFLTYIELNMLHVEAEQKQSTSQESSNSQENNKDSQQSSEEQSQDQDSQDNESEEQQQIQASESQLYLKQKDGKIIKQKGGTNKQGSKKKQHIKSEDREIIRKQQIGNRSKDLLKMSTQINQKHHLSSNINTKHERKKLSLKHPINIVRQSKKHNKTVIAIVSNKNSHHYTISKNAHKPLINANKFKQNERELQQIPKLGLIQQGNTLNFEKQEIEKQLLKNIINIKLNQQSEYARQRRKTNIPTNNKKCIKLPWITNNNTTNFNQTLFNSKNNHKQIDKQKIYNNQPENEQITTNIKNAEKQNRKMQHKGVRRSQAKLSYQKRYSQEEIAKLK